LHSTDKEINILAIKNMAIMVNIQLSKNINTNYEFQINSAAQDSELQPILIQYFPKVISILSFIRL